MILYTMIGFVIGSMFWASLYLKALTAKKLIILECSKIAYRQAWSHGGELGAEQNSTKYKQRY